jgi:hypothetical protein
MFMPWLSPHIGLGKLNKHCSFLNETEMFRSHPAAGKFAKKELPTAKLELTLENFDFDCFPRGMFTLVSEKMRSAMALGPADVQYFDVDASQSARLPQSMHYQIMHIPVTEDVSDPKNSDYTYHHFSDGSVTGALRAPSPFARTPNRRTKSSTIGFSKSFTAPMNSRCESCGRAAPEYVFSILRALAAMQARSVPFAAWSRK